MIKLALLFLAFINMHSLCANPHPQPGGFAVAGEYLYFFNGSDQTYFAEDEGAPTEAANIPLGKRYANEQEWHSGYRAELAYGFCCSPSQLQVRGTWIPTFSESRTVYGVSLFSAQGQGIIDQANDQLTFISIRVNNTFTFYAIDALYSHNIYCSPRFKLDLKEGIEYSDIGFTEHQTLVIPPNIAQKWNSRSQNIGPALALATHLDLWRNLSFGFTGTGTILASRKSASLSFVNPTILEFTSLFDDHRWFVMFACDLRAGLQYSLKICRFCFNVEVGYEFLSYFRGLERISLNDGPNLTTSGSFAGDVATGFSRNDYFNFAMHGLYVQTGISF